MLKLHYLSRVHIKNIKIYHTLKWTYYHKVKILHFKNVLKRWAVNRNINFKMVSNQSSFFCLLYTSVVAGNPGCCCCCCYTATGGGEVFPLQLRLLLVHPHPTGVFGLSCCSSRRRLLLQEESNWHDKCCCPSLLWTEQSFIARDIDAGHHCIGVVHSGGQNIIRVCKWTELVCCLVFHTCVGVSETCLGIDMPPAVVSDAGARRHDECKLTLTQSRHGELLPSTACCCCSLRAIVLHLRGITGAN